MNNEVDRAMAEILSARDAIMEFVDAVELWVEDQDDDAADFLEENLRHIFDEVSILALLMATKDGNDT